MQNDILTFTTPENSWLSNMSYVEINYQNITYPSVENFYQAMKYLSTDTVDLNFGDDELSFLNFTVENFHNKRKYISYLKPHEAKKFSKENPMTNEKFESCKINIMLFALRQKFSVEPFKSKLLNTGVCHIEEGNYWKDTFWGVDIKTRLGDNNLGKLIMQVRSELWELESGIQLQL